MQSGTVCQDSNLVEVLRISTGDFLCFACSDGAGSASHSHEGSALACAQFVELAKDFCQSSNLKELTHEKALPWLAAIQASIVEHASSLGVPVRELACTLLAGIIGPECSVFFQVGDGAIVINEGAVLRTVFWPQSGEYVNTTNFVTQEECGEKLEFMQFPSVVDELAVFSDGLERLLLRFDYQIVHEPALRPMLKQLAETPAEQLELLHQSLGEFLNSERVNSFTDDDKTLILATRKPIDVPVH
jgi:hypothetical protein